MRILVTGACGFIGFHLCKKLLELNHIVVGIDNFNDYKHNDTIDIFINLSLF